MTPEEAQKQTEERWEALVWHDELIPECGWCKWAGEFYFDPLCEKCPVPVVFAIQDSDHPVWCLEVKEYREWVHTPFVSPEEKVAAQKVYDLLISKRDELIAAAKEIENESS